MSESAKGAIGAGLANGDMVMGSYAPTDGVEGGHGGVVLRPKETEGPLRQCVDLVCRGG